MVVAIANWNGQAQSVSVNLAQVIGVQSATARDVWASSDLGTINGHFHTRLQGHQLQLLILSNIEKTNVEPSSTGYHDAASATLNGAQLTQCSGAGECEPAKAKVSNITPSSSVTFSDVQASSAGSKLVGIDFINYDVALGSAWDWGSNTRNFTISVNDAEAKRWAFPLSGGDWYDTGRLLVDIAGFQEGSNTVVFSGSNGDQWAPDLVGFEVLEF